MPTNLRGWISELREIKVALQIPEDLARLFSDASDFRGGTSRDNVGEDGGRPD
ncbi:MAG: hypothetical protein M3435_04035 [Actinomycetota bacterium]|nr:hypothetical protein [Actinomycetota bacterium]